MNSTLVISGVFVLAGLTLIVVSFLIGHARSAAGAGDGEPIPLEAANETGAFIDEPLLTDLETQLSGRKKAAKAGAGPQDAAATTEAAALLSAGTGQKAFEFRAQLGLRLLAIGMIEDAVVEFNKAFAHADDRDAKLELYRWIGDAFRAKKSYRPAAAAYLQMTSYTEDPLQMERLKQILTEMTEMDDNNAAHEALGSEKESD